MVGTNLNIIYEKLREIGIVQNKKDFCEKIDIDSRNFSKYINGDLTFEVNSKNYNKLKVLNINIEFLLTGNGKPIQKVFDIGNPTDTLNEILPILIKLSKLDNDKRQEVIDSMKSI